DGGRRGQQFRGLRHQRLRDPAVQVVLTPLLVGKRVEHGERRAPQAQGEPQGRRLLLPGHLQPGPQKARDFVFLAGLGFQAGEHRDAKHLPPPRNGFFTAPPKSTGRRPPGPLARSPTLLSSLPCTSTYSRWTGSSTRGWPRSWTPSRRPTNWRR